MIGSLEPEVEQMYGEIFAKYLADPENLFVISSDFCHWGSRFRYTYYDKSAGAIWKSIEKLDKNVNFYMHDDDETAYDYYAICLILGHGFDWTTQSKCIHRISSEVSKYYLRPSSDRGLLAINCSFNETKSSVEL